MNALYRMLADPNVMRIAVVTSVALAAMALGLGVASLIQSYYDPVRRRIAALGHDGPIEPFSVRIQSLLGPAERFVLPTRELERNRVRRRLAQAGFRSMQALSNFYAIKLALGGLMLGGALVIAQWWFPTAPMSRVVLACIVATGTGLFLPNLLVEHLVERRQRALRNGFPDALDLLVVCVEAGLGLSSALQRVSEELAVSHPELAGEFAIVIAEMRAGVDREATLKNLAERTGLEDIRGLTSLLIQTLRFGTGIADALRIYSEEFRDKRMQRAEEVAAKMGTKMIFPLVLCMFPGFMIVAVGPSILRIMETFGHGRF